MRPCTSTYVILQLELRNLCTKLVKFQSVFPVTIQRTLNFFVDYHVILSTHHLYTTILMVSQSFPAVSICYKSFYHNLVFLLNVQVVWHDKLYGIAAGWISSTTLYQTWFIASPPSPPCAYLGIRTHWVSRQVLFILQVFKAWLVGIADYLMSIEVKTPSTNGRRMCSALIILNLLRKISDHMHEKDLDPSEISLIFSMLYLKPEMHRPAPQCLDLEFLLAYVPRSHHKALANVISFFIKRVLQSDHLKKPEWLYVIPLIHFFSKKVEPFDIPTVTAKRIEWDHLGLATAVKRSTSVKVAR